jgi:hypothetical protein
MTSSNALMHHIETSATPLFANRLKLPARQRELAEARL